MKRWAAPTLASIGAVWCVVLGFLIWFTPLRYSGIVGGSNQPDQYVVQYKAFSEVSHLGALPLVVPVILAALATWAAWRGARVALGGSALLFAGFTFISGFSIGGAYVPAAGSLLLATFLSVFLGTEKEQSRAARWP